MRFFSSSVTRSKPICLISLSKNGKTETKESEDLVEETPMQEEENGRQQEVPTEQVAETQTVTGRNSEWYRVGRLFGSLLRDRRAFRRRRRERSQEETEVRTRRRKAVAENCLVTATNSEIDPSHDLLAFEFG